MTKILVLGNYAENSGYSDMTLHHMRALSSAGFDVVSRRINMIGKPREIPEDIKEMERKDLLNIHTLIQSNLPSTFSYKAGCQNLGQFCYETSNFTNSGWVPNLKLMDKIVVLCHQQLDQMLESGMETKNAYIVPAALDVTKFDKTYPVMDFGVQSAVKFYTISEYNQRKNIPALLLAYYNSFTSSDNVLLVLKVNGISHETLKNTVNQIKQSCRKFANLELYPKVVIITEYLREDELCSLHQSCDCYVSASKGEAANIPGLEAAGFGNKIIATNSTVFMDYQRLYEIDINLVESNKSTVFGVENAPLGLYTSNELWDNISIPALGLDMYNYYLYCNQLKDRKIQKNKNSAKRYFSYKTVGEIYKKVIEV